MNSALDLHPAGYHALFAVRKEDLLSISAASERRRTPQPVHDEHQC